MPRRTHLESVQMLVRVLRLVNDLAGSRTGDVGDPVSVEEFARLLGMDVDDVLWCIEKINDGCGDSAPEMIVPYDSERREITPMRIDTAFARPLRLTTAEARGLIEAVRAAGYDGDDVARSIEGAFPVLDGKGLSAIRNTVEASPFGQTIALITSACRERAFLSIVYRGPYDPCPGERVVEPLRLNFDDRNNMWYMVAWCHTALGWRTFRLDRIVSAKKLSDTFMPRELGDPIPETFSFSQATTAVLAVHDAAAILDPADWRGLIRDDAPSPFDKDRLSAQERAAGAYIAKIPWIEGSSWLAQAVVQTFGGVEVLRPVRLRDEVRDLANRILGMIDFR